MCKLSAGSLVVIRWQNFTVYETMVVLFLNLTQNLGKILTFLLQYQLIVKQHLIISGVVGLFMKLSFQLVSNHKFLTVGNKFWHRITFSTCCYFQLSYIVLGWWPALGRSTYVKLNKKKQPSKINISVITLALTSVSPAAADIDFALIPYFQVNMLLNLYLKLLVKVNITTTVTQFSLSAVLTNDSLFVSLTSCWFEYSQSLNRSGVFIKRAETEWDHGGHY